MPELIDRTERVSFSFGDRVQLPMEEYSGVAAQYQLQREVDRILRAVARANGRSYGLEAAFAAVAAGHWPALVRQLYPHASSDELPEWSAAAMETLLRLAAVCSGAATWRHSWSSPIELLDAGGQNLDLSALAARAAAPESLPAARARLAELGIDPAAVQVVEQRVSLTGGTVIAGLVNVKVDGTRSDVVVLDVGLVVLSPSPRMKMRQSKQRLSDLVTSRPPEGLMFLHGSRFVPIEEIVAVRTWRFPRRHLLRLHDGGGLWIRWGMESDEVGPGWQALDHLLAAAASQNAAGDATALPLEASRR